MFVTGVLAFSILMILCGKSCEAVEPIVPAKLPNLEISSCGTGWAANSVNTVIFRGEAVTTHGDTQYAAYYDPDGRMVIARRKLGSDEWTRRVTRFSGFVRDAHCSISIGVDGRGTIHVSWGHHGNPLRYARSIYPGSLTLTDQIPMTGKNEERVTYPEFFNLSNGDLLFLYRAGASGSGDTLINRWDVKTGQWSAVQHPLISGEGKRNAYTSQTAIDDRGVWHISWCWRETGDVATNHDICYARSSDEGRTWTRSDGTTYSLPITESTAEVAYPVPQKSQLINTGSTVTDPQGNPMISTYWAPRGTEVPQYHLIRFDGKKWHVHQVTKRTNAFSLSGGGTRRIPVSRPKLACSKDGKVIMLFRDEERGSRVSAAVCDDPKREDWRMIDLTESSVGSWEPNYDTVLWGRDGALHIFVQRVGQGQGETLEDVPPQPVSILEWKP